MSPLIHEPREISAKLRKSGSGFVITSEEAARVEPREQIRIEVDPEKHIVRMLVEPKKPDRYSMHCGFPMIPTTAFYKAELYCMECGVKVGLFSPWAMSEPATAKLHRAYEKVAREWDEYVGPFILADGQENEEMNPERYGANRKARAWLEERRTQIDAAPSRA